MLSELDINITQLHILFEVAGDSTLNQEKIASRCNTNKGAIARSIKKLEDNGFIERTIDENNRRQNIISMTEKGEMTFNKSKDILKEFEDILFENQQEKENLQIILKNLAIKMTSLNEERFDKK
ncbi:MarR family winged helix-turn-helix transcriptional regulator [Methanobrevibacter millerae]